MAQFDSVLFAASQLSVDDRLRLIDALAASVPDDRPPALSPQWLAEIDRRCKEVDSGAVATVPWETVRDDLFKKVGVKREN